MTTTLVDDIRAAALGVAAASNGTTASEAHRIADSLDEPLRVAVAGRVKAGKSTLLNALVGEELAATDAGECTRIVTWYRHGITYRVTMRTFDGDERPARFTRAEGPLRIDVGDGHDVAALVVEWPTPPLRQTVFIDTPGIGSTRSDAAERTRAVLLPESGGLGDADAVLYLMRHVHGDDVGFLEDLQERDRTWAGPVNALAVLSRADEVGAGRLDALESAARIARRYEADPRLRRLCRAVLPVAGLLAQGAAGLREDDHRHLGAIAAMSAGEREELLLTADRFGGAMDGPAPAAARSDMLDRFGLFGVRTAVAAIADGRAPSASALADELARASGIGELRRAFARLLVGRADAFKARSALVRLSAIVSTTKEPSVQALATTLERIEAGAHDLVEISVAEQLWTAVGPLPDDQVADAQRLIGTNGVAVHERLGMPAEADTADLRTAATEALSRWRRVAEHPLTGRDGVTLARVVVRSCEGALAALTPA